MEDIINSLGINIKSNPILALAPQNEEPEMDQTEDNFEELSSMHQSPFELFKTSYKKSEGMGALSNAEVTNSASISELLVECMNNPEKLPPLYYAIDKGYKEVVKILIKNYPDLISETTPKIPVYRDDSGFDYDRYTLIFYQDGKNSLELAVKKGYLEIVELLLNKGADPNITRLELTVDNGRLNNIYRMDVFQPLYWAIKNQDVPMVELLLKANASIENPQMIKNWVRGNITNHPISALKIAIDVGNDEIIKKLIHHQMPVKWLNADEIEMSVVEIFKKYENTNGDETAFNESILKNDFEAFKTLLSYVDVNKMTVGESTFCLALRQENPQYCHLLLEHDYPKKLAFEESLNIGRNDLLAHLVGYGDKDSALEIAVSKENIEGVRLLIANGYNNGNALKIGVEKDNLDIVKLLLKHGFTDPEAIKIALTKGNSQMIELFL